MPDRNELIASLKGRIWGGEIHKGGYIHVPQEEAEAILELLKEKDINVPGKWISVEDKLPPEAGQYIVAYYPCRWNWENGPISVGLNNFRGKTKWAKEYQRVTHWMPLPEPPEEDEKHGR